MNTCIILAATMWLQFDPGYGEPSWLNVENIIEVTHDGAIRTSKKSIPDYNIWSEQKQDYLNGKEIMQLIKDCR